MAGFNEIEVGRYNRYFQKLFSMKGGPPAPQLASEIAPMYPLFTGRENRYLEGWNYFWGATAGIVGVGSPAIRLTNDIGSNVIGVVEKLVVGTVAADKIDVTFQNLQPLVSGHVPNYPTIIFTGAIDGRTATSSGSQQSNLTLSSNTTVTGVGQLIHKRQAQAGVDIDIITDKEHQIVLVPQTVLQVFSEAAAGTLFASFVWRERFLEDSERS